MKTCFDTLLPNGGGGGSSSSSIVVVVVVVVVVVKVIWIIQAQYSVLGYKIDLYFHDYTFPIEINENEHGNRYWLFKKRQKITKDQRCCKFIRI